MIFMSPSPFCVRRSAVAILSPSGTSRRLGLRAVWDFASFGTSRRLERGAVGRLKDAVSARALSAAWGRSVPSLGIRELPG
jgi:hypothetical protein